MNSRKNGQKTIVKKQFMNYLMQLTHHLAKMQRNKSTTENDKCTDAHLDPN